MFIFLFFYILKGKILFMILLLEESFQEEGRKGEREEKWKGDGVFLFGFLCFLEDFYMDKFYFFLQFVVVNIVFLGLF